ncbi:concanavalin A lectin, partial [Flavobacteriaceae bacterium]|nr:concanavalin A lectin [Flavobacteriaceae bacterium]
MNPIVTPDFAPIDDICIGLTLAPFPTTSLNGITGTWSPALDNNMTTEYTFTPNSILHPCSPEFKLTITVHPDAFITPDFALIDPICAGDPLA